MGTKVRGTGVPLDTYAQAGMVRVVRDCPGVVNSRLTPAVTRLEVLDGQGMGQTIWAVRGLEES